MAIQRRYVDPAATPLVYYKILRVTLVIGVLINLAQLLSLDQANYNAYNMCFVLINLGLTIGSAIGMNMKKWAGVLCFHARTLLGILDAFVGIGIMIFYGLTDAALLGQVVGQILGAIIVFVPSYIYFAKRRLLFTPWPADQIRTSQNTASPLHNPQVGDTPSTELFTPMSPLSTEIPPICFCRKCGCKLLPGDRFCGKCGIDIMKER